MKKPIVQQLKSISLLDWLFTILTLPAVWILRDKRGGY